MLRNDDGKVRDVSICSWFWSIIFRRASGDRTRTTPTIQPAGDILACIQNINYKFYRTYHLFVKQ